jgi:alpha-tubulin suppressor-like RCC1 family protein
VDVIPREGSVVAVTAGGDHDCALSNLGVVTCWGRNDWGQLGDGTTLDRETPTRVVDLPKVQAIEAGARHTCAVAEDGGVWCWGSSSSGQLGDGYPNEALLPQKLAPFAD